MSLYNERGDIAAQMVDVFGTVEFEEGKHPLLLHVLPVDVANAVPGDCEHCVFAETARREYDATAVMFWRSTAYVEIDSRVYRFILPKKAMAMIRQFDVNGAVNPVEEDTIIRLEAPKGSQRVGARRERQKKWKRAKAAGAQPDPERSAAMKRAGKTARLRSLEGVRDAA